MKGMKFVVFMSMSSSSMCYAAHYQLSLETTGEQKDYRPHEGGTIKDINVADLDRSTLTLDKATYSICKSIEVLHDPDTFLSLLSSSSGVGYLEFLKALSEGRCGADRSKKGYPNGNYRESRAILKMPIYDENKRQLFLIYLPRKDYESLSGVIPIEYYQPGAKEKEQEEVENKSKKERLDQLENILQHNEGDRSLKVRKWYIEGINSLRSSLFIDPEVFVNDPLSHILDPKKYSADQVHPYCEWVFQLRDFLENEILLVKFRDAASARRCLHKDRIESWICFELFVDEEQREGQTIWTARLDPAVLNGKTTNAINIVMYLTLMNMKQKNAQLEIGAEFVPGQDVTKSARGELERRLGKGRMGDNASVDVEMNLGLGLKLEGGTLRFEPAGSNGIPISGAQTFSAARNKERLDALRLVYWLLSKEDSPEKTPSYLETLQALRGVRPDLEAQRQSREILSLMQLGSFSPDIGSDAFLQLALRDVSYRLATSPDLKSAHVLQDLCFCLLDPEMRKNLL